eukprot:3326396-Pleurochrysis_carterae.AAC.4
MKVRRAGHSNVKLASGLQRTCFQTPSSPRVPLHADIMPRGGRSVRPQLHAHVREQLPRRGRSLQP